VASSSSDAAKALKFAGGALNVRTPAALVRTVDDASSIALTSLVYAPANAEKNITVIALTIALNNWFDITSSHLCFCQELTFLALSGKAKMGDEMYHSRRINLPSLLKVSSQFVLENQPIHEPRIFLLCVEHAEPDRRVEEKKSFT